MSMAAAISRLSNRATLDAKLAIWLGGGVLLCAVAVALPFEYGRRQGEVEARSRPAVDVPEDVSAWLVPSEPMMVRGAEVFRLNCVACHGPEGRGDGPGGQMLAIPPRDFRGTRDAWKNGWELDSIRATITSGIGKMPPFPALSMKDKFAVAHYVRGEFLSINKTEQPDAAP